MSETAAVTCYEITHAGEGERGQKVEFPRRVQSAQSYAEDAARHLDVRELRATPGLSESDLDGGCRVIEVVGLPAGPQRFRVWTRVRLEYASQEETDGCE